MFKNWFSKKVEAPKKTLKIALGEVINSLENDIVRYDWKNQSSCNCGLIVQSLLDANENKVNSLFQSEREKTNIISSSPLKTWKAVLQQRCTATGLPMDGVFKTLLEHSFRPEDIAHLEYLSNKGILAGTKIDVKYKYYYAKKENLIEYLKSWLNILNGENIVITSTDNRAELESQLLREVDSEKYEDAAKTRNKIASLIN